VDPVLISGTVASALGLATVSQDPVSRVIEFLRNKRMLMVLDNCEHVIEGAALLAEKLIAGAPGVDVIATSRESLRAKGEWVLGLAPMDLPPRGVVLTAAQAISFSAIELFVERALATLDTFELSDADVSTVAEICRQLDGLPLAIELAAARVDLFGIRGLAARLVLETNRERLLRQEEILAALGYESVGFTHAGEAAAACGRAPTRFDAALICSHLHGADMALEQRGILRERWIASWPQPPVGRTALDHAAALRERAPGLPIILATASGGIRRALAGGCWYLGGHPATRNNRGARGRFGALPVILEFPGASPSKRKEALPNNRTAFLLRRRERSAVNRLSRHWRLVCHLDAL
jgi:hypothetical protein